jgi:hypothetical protein
MSIDKNLNYWKENAEEDYINTPISVLRYISELEVLIEKNLCENCKSTEKFLKFIWCEKCLKQQGIITK